MFLFLWVLRRRRTELARRVVLRRREARKRRFRFLQQILLTQELLLVPSIVQQYCIGEDDPGVLEKTTQAYWRRRPRRIGEDDPGVLEKTTQAYWRRRPRRIGEDERGVFGESHAVHVQTGGKILFLILLHRTQIRHFLQSTRG